MRRKIYVTFHGVGAKPDWVPESEKPYWLDVDVFQVMIADMARAMKEGKFEFVPTFDDGNLSDLQIAAPALKTFGLEGIFFPCVARIGQEGYLDEHDICALDAQGFEIGSHGIDHVSWRAVDDTTRWREVSHSKSVLEDILDHPVRSAAFPFGEYDSKVIGATKRANYDVVYSTDPGVSPQSAWMRRRWVYREDVLPDADTIVKRSASLRHNVVIATKGFLKAMR